jgi:hypothetical protein
MVNHYSMGKSVNGLGALKTASPLLEMVTGAIAVPEVALT